MNAQGQVMSSTAARMKGMKTFDARIYEEMVNTYLMLKPSSYAKHSTLLLNAPTFEDRLTISAAIRAIGNSRVIFFLMPTGVTTSRLYYLVGFLEGVVVPQLQLLVCLCEEKGHVGAGGAGKRDLADAKKKLSVALTFLTGTGAPLLTTAPRLLGELTWLATDKIPQLRNSVAHSRFRLHEEVKSARDMEAVRACGRLADLGGLVMRRLAHFLGLPEFDLDRIPDYEESSIQYEENLLRPVLPGSRKRSYREVREILERVERIGFAMLLAFISVGAILQRDGRLRLGECTSCRLGVAAGEPGATVKCPVCAKTWAFS